MLVNLQTKSLLNMKKNGVKVKDGAVEIKKQKLHPSAEPGGKPRMVISKSITACKVVERFQT